jgi:hypothetical protein
MTVNREVPPGDKLTTTRPLAAPSPVQPGRTGPASGTSGTAEPVTRATVVFYALLGAALVSWFLFGLLVLGQGFVDSAGEALGSAFTLLLVVSVVGTVRRSRRR